MNIGTMQFHSPALGRHVTYEAYLPEPAVGEGPFPVLFQLHGLGDNYSGYGRYTTMPLKVRNLPLIVITPEGGLAHWADIGPRERYQAFLVDDLWQHVHRTFPVRAGRAAVGGHSRGGAAAIRLGLKYPDRFCSVACHSGAFYSLAEMTDLHGDAAAMDACDVWRLPPGAVRPAIHMDCGVDDSFIAHNRRYHQHLLDLGVAHAYEEFPGGHTWPYWEARLDQAISRHLAVLQGE